MSPDPDPALMRHALSQVFRSRCRTPWVCALQDLFRALLMSNGPCD